MATQAQGEALAQEAVLIRKLGQQLAGLQEMGLADLRAKHLDLFGEEAKSKNLPFLRKKLAFRLQEREEEGLSPQVRERIKELAPAELPGPACKSAKAPKALPTKSAQGKQPSPRDPRLPAAGAVLRREHKGLAHEVEVLEAGFRYRGRNYRSLSSIAKEITGTAWNGFGFFGLMQERAHGKA